MNAPTVLLGEQGTDAWREVKAARFTGTRFASVMAKKDTAAYQNLIVDMAWEMVFGPIQEERFVSKSMEEGMDREAESIDWYTFHTERECFQPMFVIDGEQDYIGVSPDLLVGDDWMAQIKNPGRRAHLSVMDSRKLPSQYRWQVQGEIMVAQRDGSHFVSYIPQLGGILVDVNPSKDDHAALRTECETAYRKVNELADKIRAHRMG